MPTKRNQALIYRKVPSFLREMRKKAGLTQQELAKRMGEDQWWVTRSESGSRRVDVAEFVAFCIACGVDPTEGLGELAKWRR
jgi:transcriptional regulator with XRE-family HTH domain